MTLSQMPENKMSFVGNYGRQVLLTKELFSHLRQISLANPTSCLQQKKIHEEQI